MPDFLLEIGCEEIPARMIDAASRELRERVGALLSRERLGGDGLSPLASPRRLALMAPDSPLRRPMSLSKSPGPR